MALYSRPRNTRVLVVSLVMASLLTITIDYRGGQTGPLESAGEAAQTVVALAQRGVSAMVRPVSNFFSGLAHVGSLRAENDRLRQQIQALENQVGQGTTQQRQLTELRKLLDIREQIDPRQSVTATVIAESPDNFHYTITVDQGSAEGVKLDMAVVSGDGLVGHVIEVTSHASVVQLIIDPDSSVAGRLSASGKTGVVDGQQNRPLTMGLVGADVQVSPNEQVVTSGYRLPGGLTSIYPKDIPIGFVSHVYARTGILQKTIEIRPAVDFGALDTVLIIIRS
jgi:rod shape-determining protein MreC